ncbi:molybdopterin-dependent oxidoreductase [Microbacterium murale]|uniref:DMSO/TMAO reductase YedYZ molybdopterin-dependent catalytic subunit n=1 Tax=Microbacterium murale TaxID=1081040 RepID=A0ABU0P968_9MICO|nr:molybdopterin-dependent oxidoreductase [Microbacterium murale]MDQ0643194.1 DMSO/TMAO reductase YedYZ molybdopterin-dependent catalytic subunit [Microbacterium murale]
MNAKLRRLWAALAGLISAAAGFALAELGALVVAPQSSPLLAVGSLIIDLSPPAVKDAVIALFGTNDKVFLLVLLGIVLVIAAAGAGMLEFRTPPWGTVVLLLLGGVATVAVVSRAQSSALWALPAIIGTIGACLLLRLAIRRLHDWSETAATMHGESSEPGVAPTRRSFLLLLGGSAAVAVVVGVGARIANAASVAVTTVREAISLPKPTTTAAPIPAGSSLDIEGLSPLITPNDDFYRIDTALQVPAIDPSTWRLRVTGMVENELEISFDELLALPLTETIITLMCVSNEVGGDLIGNAVWLGYPIRELLAEAKPQSGADMVLSTSVDGFTASTPLEILEDENRNSILAVGMNGAPLPAEHGFPVRMVVPGLYGYVSATKWVTELKVTTFDDDAAYWTHRGWSEKGPIKIGSRIDVPSNRASVEAGTVAIAGVAWAQHTGIRGVEVRVDGGPWEPARLAAPISSDTWVQWVHEWDATPDDHVLEARATDTTGERQSGTPVPVVPDGAEGWHAVPVTVR